jgi:hypothetical protein
MLYIDPFIYDFLLFIHLFVLMVGMIYGASKFFAWFLNEIFDLKGIRK